MSYLWCGEPNAPGTLVFSVLGDVNRPGLYELPLGATLRELIDVHALGARGRGAKLALPGGLCSAPVTPEQFDIALDFDAFQDEGLDLGSGAVIVLEQGTSAVEAARQLARFFAAESCGKCPPCQDGTFRVSYMLDQLHRLDEPGIDWERKALQPSKRVSALPILGNGAAGNGAAGISYTDNLQGLDKIAGLCEFFKHRGDCHFSVEAARMLQQFLAVFREEFEEIGRASCRERV